MSSKSAGVSRLLAHFFWFGISVWLTASGTGAAVILNEVMFHPPEDQDDLQFVELFNAGPNAVALDGWTFTRGITATLAATNLPPGGFGLVVRNPEAFSKHYGRGLPIVGRFTGRLKHGGERLELSDATGRPVDAVKFTDHQPWPQAPDGFGASLERICPTTPGDDPANWASSKLPEFPRASGSPGRPNSAFRPAPLPGISSVEFEAVPPGKPLVVTARLRDAGGMQSAEIQYQVLETKPDTAIVAIPMVRTGGNERDGVYRAEVPPQPPGRLIRFRVHAINIRGADRWSPDPEDPRSTYSSYSLVNTNTGTIAMGHLLRLGDAGALGRTHFRSLDTAPVPNRGKAAYVLMPTNGGPVQIYDHLRVTHRSGGWKIRLFKDSPIDEMTTLNVIFEDSPRWVLAEPLSYEVLRRAGVASPKTDYVRLWVDGRPIGYHLIVEQPNKSFLRRVGRDDAGNVYKALWYGNGLVEQNEQKTGLHEGHADLVDLIAGLDRLKGDEQWNWIRERIDVDQFCNYYAACQCIQNWDGYFNNYFVHHDLHPGGRWTLIPWDEDKTWGDYDDSSPRHDWYTMPLTYGMAGDKDPEGGMFRMKTQPWGVAPWWRPGGFFSAPMLANSQFRTRFLKRLQEVNTTVFTEVTMLPVINALERRLESEVRFRAVSTRQDPAYALREFHENIESFRRQLRERHAFIQKELPRELSRVR